MWHVCRADPVAMCNGGEALHVHTEQSRERGGLYLANLREALGDVCHRAVMLTKLFTGR